MTADSTATRPWFCPRDETCPSGSHDTYSANRYGCKSGAAVEDHRLYKKRLREGRAEPRRVDSTGIARRIEACHYMGWTGPEIGAALGITGWAINRLRRRERPRVTTRNRDRMIPVLERLAMTSAPSNSPTNKVRSWARREGFRPLLAWDDIDDPNEVPLPPVSDAEQVAELAAQGRSTAYIARKLDLSPRRVAYLRDRRKNVHLTSAEIDPHLFDAVLAGRTPLADCSAVEQDHVLGRLWRDAVAQGYEHPGPQVAKRLGVDAVVVDRFRSREYSRRNRTQEEAS